jgi:hypothetical protein
MVFGIVIKPILLALGGVTAASLVVFQMLVGYRKIHFAGPLHLKVHKATAWVLLAVVSFHGLLGITFAFGLRIG